VMHNQPVQPPPPPPPALAAPPVQPAAPVQAQAPALGYVPANTCTAGAAYFIPSIGRPARFAQLSSNGIALFVIDGEPHPRAIEPTELVFPTTLPPPVQPAAAPAPVQAQTPAPVQAQAPAPAAPPSAAPQATPPNPIGTIRLFIGCRPDAGSIRLDEYVSKQVQLICDRFKVKDLRLTPRDGTGAKDKDSPLAFDGWRGVLSAVVRADPPKAGDYHAIGSNPFMDEVVGTLAAMIPPEQVIRTA
jgi:hypothetical protein